MTRGAFHKRRGAKNPMRGLAVSRLNPEHERHVGVYHDKRPTWPPRLKEILGALKESIDVKNSLEKCKLRDFKDPNPAHPGFFR